MTERTSPPKPVIVLNGPNLSRLGSREPEVYGLDDYETLVTRCEQWGTELGLMVSVRQTDSEAEMISWLHEAADSSIPVIVNPGAWTHYSYALADAAREVGFLIEVHISNIHAREEFRDFSVISRVAKGVIVGMGLAGYDYALAHVAASLR